MMDRQAVNHFMTGIPKNTSCSFIIDLQKFSALYLPEPRIASQ